MNRTHRFFLDFLFLAYRAVSPLLRSGCRFWPTCSHYAQDALATHGWRRGTQLTLIRLGRCRPWGGHGFDPVPPTGTLR